MKRNAYAIFGIVFVLSINLYLRTFTINFPQLKDRASQILEEKIQKSAREAIEMTYPDFSTPTQDRLVEVFARQYKTIHKKSLQRELEGEYARLKSRYQDSRGQTFLLELDCWNWARYTQNVLSFGHPGDRLAGGCNLDSLMCAPFGSCLMWTHFLYYSSAFLYRAFCLFYPVPLFTFLFFLPLFQAAIFFLLLYYIIYKYWGNFAAITACLYAGLAPHFLMRSSAGWYDMDILSQTLPLLAVWAYARSFGESAVRPMLAWVILSAFWVGLFAFTWPGWWFVCAVIAAYGLFSLANLACAYFQYRARPLVAFRAQLIALAFFLLWTVLWVILLVGWSPLRNLDIFVRNVLSLNKAITAVPWPNVYTTVSEVGRVALEDIPEVAGSTLLFFIALLFLLLLFLRTRNEREAVSFRSAFSIMLVFWFIGIFLASFNGRRFTVFLPLPLACALGIGVSQAYAYFKKKKKFIFSYLILGAMLILGIADFSHAYARAKTIFPLMTSDWHHLLTQLKERLPKEAVINSWWDYGDWFKTVAGRRVIFDGQSQNIPQAYWMGSALLSHKEEEAIRTLAMLNNGGNRAYEVINQALGDSLASVMLLKNVLGLKPEAARSALLAALPAPKVEEVMHLIFSLPPKAYFIVDNSLCSKMGAISYIGSWDFMKAYLVQRPAGMSSKKGREYLLRIKADNQKELETFFKEVPLVDADDLGEMVSRRQRFHSRLLRGELINGIVLFERGFVYRPKEQTAYLYSAQSDSFKVPKSLFIFDNNHLKEVIYPRNDSDLSLLVFKDKDGYGGILLDPPLAESLFVKLYFLNAAGLKHFRPFLTEKLSDGFIRVFEIVWE